MENVVKKTDCRWHRAPMRGAVCGLLAVIVGSAVVRAADEHSGPHPLECLSFTLEDQQHEVEGRVLVQADDGGVLLEGRDGVIWPVLGEQIQLRKSMDTEFSYLDAAALGEQLLSELPAGFQIHQTAHYVICYNTSNAYAQWCGALFEKLHRAFLNYWRRRGMRFQPSPPLVAVVFQDRGSYEQYGRAEVGKGIGSIIGYYSYRTNRIATFDLTGLGLSQSELRGPSLLDLITRQLSDPRAERTVATLVHEATHQLAFNCGLQTRFADVPLWYSEGLAIYFETPDPGSQRGWSSIGGVNLYRMKQFLDYLPNRPADSLTNLLINDTRFRNTASADSAYAESWALCFYLIRTRSREFIKYTQALSEKVPLESVGPQQRLREFQECFGEDLAKLDDEFIRYMTRQR